MPDAIYTLAVLNLTIPRIAELLAAGHATPLNGNGIDLLDIDPNKFHLTYKHWTGTDFSDQELIATEVPLNSLAAYLATPTSKLAICISSSTLRAIGYDEGHREWIDDDLAAGVVLHPESKLTALFGADGIQHAFIQDSQKRLIHLDSGWVPTVIPANPAEGTPLSSVVIGGKVQVFYISANDSNLHYVTQETDGSWSDKIFAPYVFDLTQKPKRIYLAPSNTGVLEGYFLAGDNTLQKIEDGGETTQLGTVDSSGQFTPSVGGDKRLRMPWGGYAVISDPSGKTGYDEFEGGGSRIHLPWGDVVISP